jgi:hypothetical protein
VYGGLAAEVRGQDRETKESIPGNNPAWARHGGNGYTAIGKTAAGGVSASTKGNKVYLLPNANHPFNKNGSYTVIFLNTSDSSSISSLFK